MYSKRRSISALVFNVFILSASWWQLEGIFAMSLQKISRCKRTQEIMKIMRRSANAVQIDCRQKMPHVPCILKKATLISCNFDVSSNIVGRRQTCFVPKHHKKQWWRHRHNWNDLILDCCNYYIVHLPQITNVILNYRDKFSQYFVTAALRHQRNPIQRLTFKAGLNHSVW